MKRIALHVVLILALGVAIGLLLRPQPVAEAPADAPLAPKMVSSAGSAAKVPESDAGTANVADQEWLSEFELIERSGESVSSEQLKGQPYVVSFFFSTCPSICVMQNQKLQELQEAFADSGVRFLSISVDPETDSPEVLREYAARFGADEDQWLFLTGDLTYIRRVGAEVYRLPVNRKFHTERFVLVDHEGKIVEYYTWTEPRQFEKLKADIRDQLSRSH